MLCIFAVSLDAEALKKHLACSLRPIRPRRSQLWPAANPKNTTAFLLPVVLFEEIFAFALNYLIFHELDLSALGA